MANSTPEQYPYEPPKPRSTSYLFVIAAAFLIGIVLVTLVGIFLLDGSDESCDERCLLATEIRGTNFAVETSVGASETAQSIAQTQTAAAEVALQATQTSDSDAQLTSTQQSVQASDEPVPQGTEQVTDEPTEAIVTPLAPTATATTTPTASPPPTATPIPTEIAAIPVRVVVVGEEIGIGTIRLFAPEAARYPETVRVELDLRLSQQIWTATPASDEDIAPAPPSLSDSSSVEEQEPAPAGTPSITPNFEESGLAVFQKMGASLFCLESSFTGCDEDSDPAEAEIITDLERGIRWSWVIRPDETISGLQDLQLVLWRVVVADDGPEEADVVWSHFFQINANPQRSQPESDSDLLPIAMIVAVAAAGLVVLVFFGTRMMQATRRQQARQVGPKVFISYRRHDTWAVARTLYDQLESRGARVFLDVKDINEGRFADIIEKNIERCEYFIPVLGPSTLESTWVRREIANAIAHNKVIIPVLVSGFTFDAPLPEDIKELESHNSITLLPEYLDAAIARLLQFLHLTDT